MAATKPGIQDIKWFKDSKYKYGYLEKLCQNYRNKTVKVLKEPKGEMYSYKIKSKNYIIVFSKLGNKTKHL